MPNATQNLDIKYQPKQENYSYSSAPEEKKKTIKRVNTFFTLMLGVFFLLLIFFLFLGVLNYFKIISLSSFSPAFGKLPVYLSPTPTPAPDYNPESKSWTINGTLYGYSDYRIKVKFHNQILNFIFNPGESAFYKNLASDNTQGTESAQSLIPAFFSDLENKNNIGKNVTVRYVMDNKENVIQAIILEN